MNVDSEKLRRYFLESLPPEEADEIDEQIISDAEFSMIVDLAENVLVEDYLENALSAEEDGLFRANYLITPERQANVDLVRLLREHAIRKHAEIKASEDPSSFLERFRLIFSGRRTLAFAGCAVVLIGLIAMYFWLDRNGKYGKIETEYAALNRQDFGELKNYAELPGLRVLPGNLRGSAPPVVLKDELGRSFFVRIALPVEFASHDRFSVGLLRENSRLVRFEALRPYENSSGKELRILLPMSILEKGEYKLNVSPADRSDSSVAYTFSVN